jgi:hypothetical protein
LKVKHFQTMGEIAVNQNSTIVLPVPLDLFKPFLEEGNDGSSGGGHGYEGKDNSPKPRREGEREAERRYKETLEDVSREGSSGEISRDANQEANPKQISTGARGANMKTRRTFGAKASAALSP